MRKVSEQSASHNPGARSSRPNYYVQLAPGEGGHPVDLVVQQRLPLTEKCDSLMLFEEQVLAQLGADTKCFIDYDSLRSDICTERQEVYFNLGYEYGLRKGLARGKTHLPHSASELAKEIRERVVQRGLPSRETIYCLLEIVCNVAAMDETSTK